MTETTIATTEETQLTLAEILTVMEYSEESLEGFDPAVIVGSLNDKIDSIYLILEKMKATKDHLKDLAKPFTTKARAIEKAHDRLREYIAFQMKERSYPSLPGRNYKANLRLGNETVVIKADRQPTAMDMKDLKRFIQTNVSFDWNHDEIEKAYLAGEELPPIISAHKTQSSWVEFRVAVPDVLEKKAKVKK